MATGGRALNMIALFTHGTHEPNQTDKNMLFSDCFLLFLIQYYYLTLFVYKIFTSYKTITTIINNTAISKHYLYNE